MSEILYHEDGRKDMRTDMRAVVGTNAWGDALYGKMLRGSFVEEDVIREAVQTAIDEDIAMFDTARDYGLGKGRPGLLVPGEWHLFLGMGGSGRRNACSSKKDREENDHEDPVRPEAEKALPAVQSDAGDRKDAPLKHPAGCYVLCIFEGDRSGLWMQEILSGEGTGRSS